MTAYHGEDELLGYNWWGDAPQPEYCPDSEIVASSGEPVFVIWSRGERFVLPALLVEQFRAGPGQAEALNDPLQVEPAVPADDSLQSGSVRRWTFGPGASGSQAASTAEITALCRAAAAISRPWLDGIFGGS